MQAEQVKTAQRITVAEELARHFKRRAQDSRNHAYAMGFFNEFPVNSSDLHIEHSVGDGTRTFVVMSYDDGDGYTMMLSLVFMANGKGDHVVPTAMAYIGADDDCYQVVDV